MPTLAVTAFGALCLTLAFLVRVFLQWYRLSHVPGPFWASLSRAWMVRESLKGRQPQAIKAVTDKYGPLARIGPNELVTSDPEILRRMMAVRSPYTKGPWYSALKLEPGKDNLLSTRDGEAHAKLRNKMAAGYSGKENESMEATIDTQILNLCKLIERKYLSTAQVYRPMDWAEKVQYFTLDVISDLAFGQSFGHLEQDDDVYGYIQITKAYIPIMLILANVPELASLMHSRFFRSALPKESDKLGFGAFIGVAKKVVAERFDGSAKPRKDMLASFIRHGLDQDQVSGEALLQIIAGSDTSATTIRIVMLHLLAHPLAYQKLAREIRTGIDAGRISNPITDAEGRQLPFLQAVIKEGLRILPPAGGLFFKTVPPGGDVIEGMFIPAGTQIGSSPFGIHHSQAIFGPDAEVFRPDRWLDAAEPDKLAEMERTVDLAFHYGKNQCLGKNVALMEFNKIFVELFRRFDFSIVHPATAASITNAGIWMMEDFEIRIQRHVAGTVSD